MMDVMFDAPSDDTICTCRITKEAVEGTEQPIITRGEAAPAVTKKKSERRRAGRPETA